MSGDFDRSRSAQTYERGAAQEIERLERELAELYALLGSVRGAYEQIEAHNAAMRGALEECVRHLGLALEAQGTSAAHMPLILQEYKAALSPDDGRRVLAVVEAVKEWRDLLKPGAVEATTKVDAERKILKALAALEEK